MTAAEPAPRENVLRPDSPESVLDAVRWAAAEETPLEIIGRGSKRGVGRPVQAEYTLDLSGLTGVTLYEPDELVLSARAGTSVAEIEALLAEHDQELAFEPLDYGGLANGEADLGTIGGALAANVSGPRRLKAGAARDHVLGIHAVSGRGEAFKSGGRVVKNVTGYDLPRGLAGSWGTLAIVTELTFKVLPRAETAATVLLTGLDDATAVRAMCGAMGSTNEVSGAAHLPAGAAARLPLPDLAGLGQALTALRLEGVGPSVAYRTEKLVERMGAVGPVETLDTAATRALWAAIRDAVPFAGRQAPLWRVSVAPTAGPAIAAALAGQPVRHFYDWSGGLIWLEVADEAASDDAFAGTIRTAIEAAGGGHATLVRGSAALRTSVPPFQPQPDALAALSRRLKQQFDPRGILNPGRMVAGF
jgi:glycolate oxidase FAD binding subunit